MINKPLLLQRVYSASLYLAAGLLLTETSRTLLSRLRSRMWHQRQGQRPTLASNPSSVAFLVDAENIFSPRMEGIVELALDEAKKLGEVNIKRVYGNCFLFNNNNNKWNDTCLHLDLEQIHLAKPTPAKNTADIALAVDATELAVEGTCNRFCIVTSDSDFTPLVRRLRALKCQVLGIGEKKTPKTLIKACNWFVFTEQIIDVPTSAPPPPARNSRSQPFAHPANEPLHQNQSDQPPPSPQPEAMPATQPEEDMSERVISVLTEAYLDAAHGRVGEWVLLSRLGLSLRQRYPDFQAVDYAEDLSGLIRQYPTVFEFGKRANGHPQMRLK
jgi:NYN domain